MNYQKKLAELLATSGALFFQKGLELKDGRPTPYFINMGIFRTGNLALELGQCFAYWLIESGMGNKLDLIIGPSYKGSAIAQAAAMVFFQKTGQDLAFDYDRKEAKTHGEATGHGLLFVTGAALEGGKALIVDDVGTSMRTKYDLLKKLSWLEPRQKKPLDIMGVALAVDRQQVQPVYNGEGRLKEFERGPYALDTFQKETGLTVWSLLGIKDCIKYLAENEIPVMINGKVQPLDKDTLDTFWEYMEMYGV